MNTYPTALHHSGVPAFVGAVTVPGEYFMPLVEAVLAAAAWCARKTRDLRHR